MAATSQGSARARPKATASGKTRQRPAEEKKARKKHLDELLDQALKDTFPASDPIELTEP